MKITGLQKMTLLDYPGRIACTVFLQGCNFRCPFCHNSGILSMDGEEFMTEDELMAFLQKRVGLLDGVCLTGGEPTLYKGMPDLIRRIKALGFAVKLDTNGSRPEVLKSLVEEGLIDYCAVDVKNAPDRYCQTAGMSADLLQRVEESLKFLLEGSLDYEFRTTVVAEFHDEAAFCAMGTWLKTLSDHKAKRFFLQCFVARESVLKCGLTAPTAENMENYRRILANYAQSVEIRGMD